MGKIIKGFKIFGIILAVLFALIVIGVIVDVSNDDEQAVEKAKTEKIEKANKEKKEAEAKAKAEQKAKDKAKKDAEVKAKEKAMTDSDRVKKIAVKRMGKKNFKEITDFEDGRVLIKVVPKEAFSDKGYVEGINRDVVDMMPKIFKKTKYTKVVFQFVDKYVDAKGNSSEGISASVIFTRENSDTIQWDNILTKNVPLIADEYTVHPSLREALAEASK